MSKPVQGICPSCNVAYVDHLGLIPLCEVRQVFTKENNELRAELAVAREECFESRTMLGVCYKHISGRADRFSEREKAPMLYRIKRRIRRNNLRIGDVRKELEAHDGK